ncbi:hypothetical protein N5P37_001901, partial [Trichoderma harzianum]
MFQHGFILTDRVAVSSRHIDISCRHGGPSLGGGKGLNASVVRCLWPTRYQDHEPIGHSATQAHGASGRSHGPQIQLPSSHCSPVFVLAVPGPQHWNRRSRK